MDNISRPTKVGDIVKDLASEKSLDSELKTLHLARNKSHLQSQIEKISLIQMLASEVLEDYNKNQHLDDPLKRAGSYKRMINELEGCLELLKKEI